MNVEVTGQQGGEATEYRRLTADVRAEKRTDNNDSKRLDDRGDQGTDHIEGVA